MLTTLAELDTTHALPAAQGLLLLIAFIGFVAIIVVFGLLVSWRRYNERLNKQQREASPDMEDTWRAAADRIQPDDADEDDDDAHQ